MAQSNPRFLSRRCQVFFLGWESDTYRLQQCGWQLAVEQDVRGSRINLVMYHPRAGTTMFAETTEWDFMHVGDNRLPAFTIRRITTERVYIETGTINFDELRVVDAKPSFVTTERKCLEDFFLFNVQQVRTEEIIVEPETVMALLEKIKKLQSPELAAIPKRNATRDFEPAQNFHAQIISLRG